MAGLAESLFPRSSRLGHLSGYHPRALLGAVLDVASLPGRAYASLGRMEDESYLDALGRTVPRYVVGQGEGDEMADAILRDPLTPAGFGVGAAIKGLRPILGLGADLGTNAAGMAADQYATTGSVNGTEIGAGAGMGALLGLGGMAKGGKRAMISPEEREANFRNWFGDSKVVDEAGKPLVVYHGTDKNFDVFDPEKLGSLTGAESAKKGFFFTNNPENADFYAGWTPSKEGYDYVSDLVKRKESAVRSTQDEFEKMRRANRRIRRVDEDSFLSDDQLVAAGYAKEDIPQLRKEWVYSPEEMAVYNQRKDLNKRLAEEESALDVARTLAASNSIGRDFSSGVTPNVMPVNLALKNPLIHQQAGDFRDITFSDILDRAKSSGNDGVIIRGTRDPMRGDVFVALDPTQIKSATGNRGTFDPNDPNITHFAGSASAPSRNRATTRLERQAAQVAYDKYGRPREESAGRPVSTFQGLGSLLSSPSDTYYTRGGR